MLESRAQYAASRVRRFARWLHHPAISPPQWYRPVLQAALMDWPADSRLYVALDTTALTPFVLIRASLVYRGRTIPLAWRAVRHRSTQVGFEDYQSVLNQVRAIVPPGMVIILLADRGFVHEQLLDYLRKQQWHFRLRLKGNTLIYLSAQQVSAVRDLCPPAGNLRFFHEMALLAAAVGPVHLALASPVDHPDDPWFVGSSEPTDARTLDEYGLRFDIEESFLDEKSGGYQIHTSKLATPEALERLLLIEVWLGFMRKSIIGHQCSKIWLMNPAKKYHKSGFTVSFMHFPSQLLLLLSQFRLACEAALWAYDQFSHES